MDQMQQGLGFNLKDDLFKYLGGEITLNVDNPSGPDPEWKAVLQVSDPGHLQATLTRLLAAAGMRDQRSSDGELTYHSLPVPNPNKPMEVSYTFVDGYWVIGSSQKTVREAVRRHRAGESLAKSQSFLAALPPGHSPQASALLYEDSMAMAAMSMAKFSPEMAAAFSQGTKPAKPAVICAYGEESAIREASMSSGVDAGAVMVMGAIAIPNLLRARMAANESSAVGNLRTLVTAQIMYSAGYPTRGFARDLATLGPFPGKTGVASANHASLIDSQLGNGTCTAGAWCEKSGYRFAFAPVCKVSPCKEFVAVATPVSTSTGSRNFCATSDGVIRFVIGPPLTSTITAAKCTSWAPLQ
jgi:type IV pilus assembly protein PilA